MVICKKKKKEGKAPPLGGTGESPFCLWANSTGTTLPLDNFIDV